MALGTAERSWIPLGNAKIIDWKYLEKEVSARGATAWISWIFGETVLVRTWCEETVTHFDFEWLAHASRSGHLSIRVSRPEPARLMVKLQLDASNLPQYTEVLEFTEHPRTGLQGRSTRIAHAEGISPPVDSPRPRPLAAAEAEIFEYAAESALHTECGLWFGHLLEELHAHFEIAAEGGIESKEAVNGASPHMDREISAAIEAVSPSIPAPREPPPIAPPPVREPPPPEPVPVPRPRMTAPEPDPEPIRPPPAPSLIPQMPGMSPERAPPPSAVPSRLFVATNAGESWEIGEGETYIGRSKQCTVVLKSQRVSRKHASVTFESGAWFINDLGAANGIWAGSEKVEREPIEDGSEYIIGDVLLTFTFA